MLKIGVIGCGAIGTEICKAIDSKLINAELVGIYDRSAERCQKLIGLLAVRPGSLAPADLIAASDIVVECASQAAVLDFGAMVLSCGKDLMVMSVGALTDPDLLFRLKEIAAANASRIYIPSGAIAGLDGLKSASMAHVNMVTLTTTKNPGGLKGAPFVIENNIDLDSFRKKTLLFEGSAEEAIAAFPANVNVAASLSLAGIGTKKTRVRIFVDPETSRNIHEISVEGEFGKFTCKVENVPSPDNPRTSYLAALSAIATLKKISEPLQVGT
ncbi:MAG: aspartate dehydrogenase [Candidatus Methanoperedens sp.]|nr:aspartate dehydrogenase [Candidatus Methanoperedens sp.]MCZ7370876.1 aspartate dehydrogenase [Candidatus Methanoperedens sp.]